MVGEIPRGVLRVNHVDEETKNLAWIMFFDYPAFAGNMEVL